MARLRFVLAPAPDPLVRDLVEALVDELALLGADAGVAPGGVPDDDAAAVPVFVGPAASAPSSARSILLATELPGTPGFAAEADHARCAGAVLAVHADAVRELRHLGLSVDHAPAGWTGRWAAAADGPARDVDVLHLGEHTPRRGLAFSRFAPQLVRFDAQLWFGDADATALLPRARVLVAVHAADRPHLDALVVVRALAAGVAVVTEQASGTDPLVPGSHLLAGGVDRLGLLTAGLLEDEPRRAALAVQAAEFLRAELPLRATAERLAARADEVAGQPVDRAASVPAPFVPDAPAPPARYPSPIATAAESDYRAALKDVRLGLLGVRREVRRRELAAAGPVAPVELTAVTALPGAPRVSVITALYNHAEHIEEALDSLLGTPGIEHVITDDGSTDGSGDTVRTWMDAHPDVAVTLLRHPVNRGLGQARNTALALARGERTFVLDADNAVHPRGVERLAAALDADPGAAFAFAYLEMFEDDEPAGLKNVDGWEPALLRVRNIIDAMVLWRTDAVRALGGYTTDVRLHGWEDYDLWCRLAEGGGRGVLVPEILARYRVSGQSMLSLTDLSWRTMVSVLAERYPRTMGGVVPPL